VRTPVIAALLLACRPQPTPPPTTQPEPPPTPQPDSPPATVEPDPPPATVEPEPPPAPIEPDPPPATVEPEPPPDPCERIDRGKPQPKHESLGQTVADLESSGGTILCGRGPLWQLRFGTLCGDLASFHRVITVEVKSGRIHRVWQRQQYNDSFCGEF
jgi:hypothetical protein